jgi:hypothetical protein
MPLYPLRNSPHSHCISGWVRPIAHLADVEQRKISCPYRELTPDRPARSLVASPTKLFLLRYPYDHNSTPAQIMVNPLQMLTCSPFMITTFFHSFSILQKNSEVGRVFLVFFFVSSGGMRLSSLGTSATYLAYCTSPG